MGKRKTSKEREGGGGGKREGENTWLGATIDPSARWINDRPLCRADRCTRAPINPAPRSGPLQTQPVAIVMWASCCFSAYVSVALLLTAKFIYIHENVENEDNCTSIKQDDALTSIIY